MKKRILALLMVSVLVLSTFLTGCGGDKDKNKESNAQGDGPWYKTKYHDIVCNDNEYIGFTAVYDDIMYYTQVKYSEEGGSRNIKFNKLSLKDFTTTEFDNISMKENYYPAATFADESGFYVGMQMLKWDSSYEKLLDSAYQIVHYDTDGNKVSTLDITEELQKKSVDGMQAYIGDLVRDKEGNLILTDNQSFVMAFDKDNNKMADIATNGWGESLSVAENGDVYYIYTDEDTYDQVFAKVNLSEKTLEKCNAKIEAYNVGYGGYHIDKDNRLCCTVDNDFVYFDMETGEKTTVFSWLDYDINADYIDSLYIMDDGRIVLFVCDYVSEKTEYQVITMEESDEPLEEKTIITYATFGTDSDISSAIIRFNKNSEKYRIKVVDYYSDDEDYETSFSAYEEAVLGGNAADIVNVQTSTYESLAQKGMYADLNEMIENDPDVKRSDYFENVLDAFELDGKLYAMPTSFQVSTLIGREDVWKGKENYTLEDIQNVLNASGEGTELMDYMSKQTFLFTFFQGMADQFIDWETGECSFDSKEFIELLEMANSFPAEYDYDGQTLSTWEKLQSGKVLLYGESFYEISGYQIVGKLFDAKTIVLGYPGAKGNGALIQNTDSALAISNDSPNKEAAWEFVKYMISEEYQSNYISWQNPIHKGAFDKMMEKAKKAEYYTDENGNKVESAKMTYGWDDFEISVYAATDEEVAEYKAILEGAETLAYNNGDVMTMINEEVAPFFDGKKSAEEVAKIIQGRVKIFVNESR